MAGSAPGDGVRGLRVLGNVVDGLGAIERQGVVVHAVVVDVRRVGVPPGFESCVHQRPRRKSVGMNVVAASAEVVVGVPRDVRRQHRQR